MKETEKEIRERDLDDIDVVGLGDGEFDDNAHDRTKTKLSDQKEGSQYY